MNRHARREARNELCFTARRNLKTRIALIVAVAALFLPSAFSDCYKSGFSGPTDGSNGNVLIYYKNNAE